MNKGRTITFTFIKYIYIYYSRRGMKSCASVSVCAWQRKWEGEGDEGRLPYWPITSSSLDHTTSLPLLFYGSGQLRAVALSGSWLAVSRPKSPDWRLTLARHPLSVVGRVHIISQRARIPVVIHGTCFRLFTQVRSAITLFIQLEYPDLSKVSMQQLLPRFLKENISINNVIRQIENIVIQRLKCFRIC